MGNLRFRINLLRDLCAVHVFLLILFPWIHVKTYLLLFCLDTFKSNLCTISVRMSVKYRLGHMN